MHKHIYVILYGAYIGLLTEFLHLTVPNDISPSTSNSTHTNYFLRNYEIVLYRCCIFYPLPCVDVWGSASLLLCCPDKPTACPAVLLLCCPDKPTACPAVLLLCCPDKPTACPAVLMLWGRQDMPRLPRRGMSTPPNAMQAFNARPQTAACRHVTSLPLLIACSGVLLLWLIAFLGNLHLLGPAN